MHRERVLDRRGVVKVFDVAEVQLIRHDDRHLVRSLESHERRDVPGCVVQRESAGQQSRLALLLLRRLDIAIVLAIVPTEAHRAHVTRGRRRAPVR